MYITYDRIYVSIPPILIFVWIVLSSAFAYIEPSEGTYQYLYTFVCVQRPTTRLNKVSF